ncbi:hypothetical protein GCM10007160_17530 [Litchfieldella qijiaojingensis]|uniref:Uncharacterized protein n=1 Tax=Litchfieldella qijiaojingensis TaxID=980347 RepID=A0ABQ2YPI9_9GAMM|nr:DUF6586 family protein [Halomonas qijiaojingensis]GGX90561.1 hypothetical protein GCM10007160_17530 [Halomonas qijiaojingensis]
MTPRGRTNQLLYQAELLLDTSVVDDEHAMSRRMAREEGALALVELALNSALRELTEHAMLERHDWHELLGENDRRLAELERLRELARRDDSWLAVLLRRLEALHDVDGAAQRESVGSPALISTAERLSLADELKWCVREFKHELASMRETSFEW